MNSTNITKVTTHISHNEALIFERSQPGRAGFMLDRKSTRLNSSHLVISYAVFCLKKKKYYTTAPTSSPFKLYSATPPSRQSNSSHICRLARFFSCTTNSNSSVRDRRSCSQLCGY